MNLSEALNVALPELPARSARKVFPRVHPKLIMREHIEDGAPTMVACISGGTYLYRFSPEQWQLVQLFNGERSYEEVSQLFQEQSGIAFDAGQIREFAESLEELEFWYRTAAENITAAQKAAEQRHQHLKRKTKAVDMAQMVISTWDPDEYLSWLHRQVSFIYTPWFTAFTLLMFSLMVAIFASGWGEIWQDTVKYYTFTEKSAADLGEFWLLFFGLGF